MSDRNDDLAYQALDFIREHPEEWSQRFYFCETTACYAGRVLLLDAQNRGEVLDWSRIDANRPGQEAAAILGWNWEDARTVFGNMTRHFSELERLVKNVMNGTVEDSDRIPRPLTP